MPPVQHRYAKITKTGEAVSIQDVSKQDGPFQCLDVTCGQELIAHKGDINAHYFAHRPDSKCTLTNKGGGGGESSEHLFCKLWVAKYLHHCQFYKPCETCGQPPPKGTAHVLTASKVAVTEFKIGQYIVDIAIVDMSNQTATAVVEIYHTHATDAKKFEELYKTVSKDRVHEVKTDELLPLISALGRSEPTSTVTITECMKRPRSDCAACRLDLVHHVSTVEKPPASVAAGRTVSLYGQPKRKYRPPCSCCGTHDGVHRVACAPYRPSIKTKTKRHYRMSCAGCSKLCDQCKENHLDIMSEGTWCYRCTMILSKQQKSGDKRSAAESIAPSASRKFIKGNDSAAIPASTASSSK